MSTDLERQAEFANPLTGEVLTLSSPDEDLGRYLADLREFEGMLRESKRAVGRELLARMDRAAKWTIRAGGVKLSGPSPAKVEEWDGVDLRSALLALVDEGVLSIEAVDAAVEVEVTYKPVKRGINQLRKLGGRVADTINALARESEPDRRISVST